ncbi:SDR family oxidoreductase [Ferrovibrio sp.]|uniref:SDR family oxidoreductase n=1 Tax=Ferrovibrio sp. TaxID=1917215 RepID=UPI0026132D70|nr:SDR family oxidoreductase [Ferrovibrio sp.]
MPEALELFRLSGRVVAITGAAGHLGRCFAEAAAQAGADLVLIDLDAAGLQTLSDTLTGRYTCRVLVLPFDLRDEAALRGVPAAIRDGFGRLDVLVNCAAFVGTSRLEGWAVGFREQSSAAWRAALEVNLTAPFILSQVCTDLLTESGSGSLIMIGSIYGMLGPDWSLYEGTAMANPAAYAASKGGLEQLVRWLATTLAPGLRVNGIIPGGIARGQPQVFVERYEARTPLRRMASEDDFVGAFLYLASDASRYVTGQCLVVDGGWSAW